jgi:hypothetical protein
MGPKIAVIDSGINPSHPHVGGVAGGVSFFMGQRGKISFAEDFSDRLGHGTAIAGVIREKSPKALLFGVKIFHEALRASGTVLLSALEWAIENRMDIIQLSLGTQRRHLKSSLDQICRKAVDEKIVVIAAARTPDDEIYPAAFPQVIGAYWNRSCEPETISFHPGCRIEFGAFGRPRPLPGLPMEKNFSGHSFAAARMTARIAALLETCPGIDLREIKKQMISYSEEATKR